MRNRKNNKRALIVSALSLLLCVSMLVGSTFAWFTDDATTGVNTIQAGTLDIQLLMQDSEGNWVDAENKTLEFIDKDENNLWEPGCIYQLPALKVVNNGSLALKFKLVINRLSDDGAKLAEVLDVGTIVNGAFTPMDTTTLAQLAVDPDGAAYGNLTAKGTDGAESNVYPLALRMQTTAGNEYQGLTLETMSITVMAAQDTVESDSFGNTYDEEADYDTSVLGDVWDGTAGELPEESEDGTIAITNAEEFAAFAAAVNEGNTYEGKTVKLSKSIDLDGKAWTSISSFAGTFDGQGNTISNLKDAALFDMVVEAGVVKNVTLKDASITNIDFTACLVKILAGTLDSCTVKDAVYTSNNKAGAAMVRRADATAKINNCHVDGFTLTVTSNDNGDQGGVLVASLYGGEVTNSSVSNVTINASRKTKNWGGFVGLVSGGTVKNCSAENVKITVAEYYQFIGGFVGMVNGTSTIKDCNAKNVTIDVTSNGNYECNTGGFCGATSIGNGGLHTLDNCDVTGLKITVNDASSDGSVGAFTGRVSKDTAIKNCDVSGTISATAAVIETGRVTNSYVVPSSTDMSTVTIENNNFSADVTSK